MAIGDAPPKSGVSPVRPGGNGSSRQKGKRRTTFYENELQTLCPRDGGCGGRWNRWRHGGHGCTVVSRPEPGLPHTIRKTKHISKVCARAKVIVRVTWTTARRDASRRMTIRKHTWPATRRAALSEISIPRSSCGFGGGVITRNTHNASPELNTNSWQRMQCWNVRTSIPARSSCFTASSAVILRRGCGQSG